jgi:sugar lactone lactonase YvrE
MRIVVEAHDRLGEGPCWAEAEGRLYWFDIKGQRLHWLTVATGVHREISLALRASAGTPRASGGLLMATDAGLATFDAVSEQVTLVSPMLLPPGFRTNDGGVDPQGRFWWSVMDDNGGERPGTVFLHESGGKTEEVLGGVHIPNALCVTADGATLYLADSKLRTLFAYDLPNLAKRRVFATTPEGIAPDGSALDAEGFLWNAQWGGGRLVRYAPDGSIDRIVELPVRQPTSCAFGGPDLRTLYVTSAWDGLSGAERAEQPQAGSLFAFEPGAAGLRLPAFDG